jgi:mono/diheme cytochrome c family protein
LKRVLALAGAAAAVSILPSTAGAGTGSQVWSQAGCGGCHTLAAAGSTGIAGPNLDYLRPSSGAVASQVTYGGGGMPSFGGSLSTSEIQSLATWVSSVAGGTTSSTPAAAPQSSMPAARVRKLQSGLAKLGFFHHVVTGYYGPVTTKAVKRFQRFVGLTPDGIWGPKTAAALKARL